MPRHLTVGTAIEVTKLASNIAFVETLEFEIVDPSGAHVDWVRVVKNNENITFQGNLYTASTFALQVSGESGQEPKVTVQFNDVSGVIRDQMEAYDGGTDFPVTYRILNTAALDQPPEIEETFKIASSEVSGDFAITFNLGVDGALSRKFPRRVQYAERCSHIFKDTRCAYAGGLGTCDYTLNGTNGCKVHSNLANFGGFPGLTDRF